MYTEDKMHALPHRVRLLRETNEYLDRLRAECDARRAARACDAGTLEEYEAAAEPLREEFIEMLGRPLTEMPDGVPTEAEIEFVAEDELGTIERIHVTCAPGLSSYGLLFTPRASGKTPLVVALHGGGGTCERVSSFYDSANYNDLVQKVRAGRPVTVYVPQLLLWKDYFAENEEDRVKHIELDVKLKQCGGSIAALEIFKIRRTVDWILANRDADEAHMGILGLSYGGFYALFNAAYDTRYRTVLSSCFVNDRYRYSWGDYVWFDSASRFLDGEVAGLICPRALCVQAGENDTVFTPEGARRSAGPIAAQYDRLGIGDRFRFVVHPCSHEFIDTDLDFFFAHL